MTHTNQLRTKNRNKNPKIHTKIIKKLKIKIKKNLKNHSFIPIIHENSQKKKFKHKYVNKQLSIENKTKKPQKKLKITMFIFKELKIKPKNEKKNLIHFENHTKLNPNFQYSCSYIINIIFILKY